MSNKNIEVVEKKSRYSVSRKGMGGRKAIHTREYLDTKVVPLLEAGNSLKKVAEVTGKAYVSLRAALKREGLPTKRVKKPEEELTPTLPAGTSIDTEKTPATV